LFPLDGDIAERAIGLRQQHDVPLADSVIAATGIHLDATLVTRNTADFDAVPSLHLYNPYDLSGDGSAE
jgi:predicted nucleic acid-binding protein